jgi:hypothetical protein
MFALESSMSVVDAVVHGVAVAARDDAQRAGELSLDDHRDLRTAGDRRGDGQRDRDEADDHDPLDRGLTAR